MKVEFIISYLLISQFENLWKNYKNINNKFKDYFNYYTNSYLYNWNSIGLFNHGIFDCYRLDVYIILC